MTSLEILDLRSEIVLRAVVHFALINFNAKSFASKMNELEARGLHYTWACNRL